MTTATARRRAGFTLIELLVAIGLALVITALTVAVLNSGAIESQGTVQASDRATQWLITAKNRAKRDQRPRGVRFTRASATAGDPLNNYLTEGQYIELPDPYAPNANQDMTRGRIAFVYGLETNTSSANYGTVILRQAYYTSDVATDLTDLDANVKDGDFLNLPTLGTVHRLTGNPTAANVTIAGASKAARLLMLSTYQDLGAAYSNKDGVTALGTPPQVCYTTYSFSFQGGARPLFGEPLLQLGTASVIDSRLAAGGNPSTTLDKSLVTQIPAGTGPLQDIEIMFAPSGQVLSAGPPGEFRPPTYGLIALWVRNPNLGGGPFDYGNAGDQVLAVVYTRTGNVATHPVTPSPPATSPFIAAKDGINTGF